MKMLKLEDGEMRLTCTVQDDDRLGVGKYITLKGSDHKWRIVATYTVPTPNRGWKNNI